MCLDCRVSYQYNTFFFTQWQNSLEITSLKRSIILTRAFGCLLYVHDHQLPNDKFHELIRPCVFLGHPHGKKGWSLYDYQAEKFVISRDVIFVQDTYPYASSMGMMTDTDQDSYGAKFNFGEVRPIGEKSKVRGSKKDSWGLLSQPRPKKLLNRPRPRPALHRHLDRSKLTCLRHLGRFRKVE